MLRLLHSNMSNRLFLFFVNRTYPLFPVNSPNLLLTHPVNQNPLASAHQPLQVRYAATTAAWRDIAEIPIDRIVYPWEFIYC